MRAALSLSAQEVRGISRKTDDLSMSRQQQQLLMAWDRQYPVTAWEKERDNRIAAVMGHHNPFVTGERQWTLGYKPVGEGIVSPVPARNQKAAQPDTTGSSVSSEIIIGNKNSHIYHLPQGCPSYTKVSAKNQVPFNSEAEAQAAGYRKAGNCK